MRLVRWTPDDLVRRLDDVVSVYGEAMGYRAELLQTRRGYIGAHVRRAGFRAVATLTTDGRLAVWMMRGGTVASTALVNLNVGPNSRWQIATIGDINKDGFADIIWQTTDAWLARHGIGGHTLMMRSDRDRRPAAQVKVQLLQLLGSQMAISLEHAQAAGALPGPHKDPFDRMPREDVHRASIPVHVERELRDDLPAA